MQIISLADGVGRWNAQLVNDVDVFEVAAVLVVDVVQYKPDLVPSVGDDLSLQKVRVPVKDHLKLGVFLSIKRHIDFLRTVNNKHRRVLFGQFR